MLGFQKAFPQLHNLGFQFGLGQLFAGVIHHVHCHFQRILGLLHCHLCGSGRLDPPAFLGLHQFIASGGYFFLGFVELCFQFFDPLFCLVGIQVPKCICHRCLPI
ncbi:MAG: hypothetical protein D9N14_10335 [Ketobacter sp.]|nr:MAG: hypothetical protein D9N14_10335 [Ketobacter sp.]